MGLLERSSKLKEQKNNDGLLNKAALLNKTVQPSEKETETKKKRLNPSGNS